MSDIMIEQNSDIRLLTEQEFKVVSGGVGVDVPVQILGRTLHIWASTDVGISGAYWTRTWDGSGWH
jgi:hypothetical protein